MKMLELIKKVLDSKNPERTNEDPNFTVCNELYLISPVSFLKSMNLFNDNIKKRYAQINTENFFKQKRNLVINDMYGTLYLSMLNEEKKAKKSTEHENRNSSRNVRVNSLLRSALKTPMIKKNLYKFDRIILSLIKENLQSNIYRRNNFFIPLISKKGIRQFLKNANRDMIYLLLEIHDDKRKIIDMLRKREDFFELIVRCNNEKVVDLTIKKFGSVKYRPVGEIEQNENDILAHKKEDSKKFCDNLKHILLNNTNLFSINEKSHFIYLENIEHLGLVQLFRIVDHFQNNSFMRNIIEKLNTSHVLEVNSVVQNQEIINITKKALFKLSKNNIAAVNIELKNITQFNRITMIRTIIDESFEHMIDLYGKFLESQDLLTVFIFECQLFDYIKESHKNLITEKEEVKKDDEFLVLGSFSIGGNTRKAANKIKKAAKFMKMLSDKRKIETEGNKPNCHTNQNTKLNGTTLIGDLVKRYLNSCFKRGDYLLVDMLASYDDLVGFEIGDFRNGILKDKRMQLYQKIELIDRYYEILEKSNMIYDKSPRKISFDKLTAYEIRKLDFSDQVLLHIENYKNMENVTEYQVKNFIWFSDKFLNKISDPAWIIEKCDMLSKFHSNIRTLIDSLKVRVQVCLKNNDSTLENEKTKTFDVMDSKIDPSNTTLEGNNTESFRYENSNINTSSHRKHSDGNSQSIAKNDSINRKLEFSNDFKTFPSEYTNSRYNVYVEQERYKDEKPVQNHESRYDNRNYESGYDNRNYDSRYDDRNYDNRNHDSRYDNRNYDSRDMQYNNRDYGSRHDNNNFDYRDDRYESRYDNRNYENRNYDDRNYDNRNYDNRNYDDRNYDDRNYDNRNYDNRNYDDRNYDDRNYDNNSKRLHDNRSYDNRSYNERMLRSSEYDNSGYKNGYTNSFNRDYKEDRYKDKRYDDH